MIRQGFHVESNPGRHTTALCWVATIIIIVVYASFMRERILAHAAIPYFDQASYIDKTHTLSGMLASPEGVRALANPLRLLAVEPAYRGFLMPLAAALIVGGDADPRAMSLVWLTIRLVVLVMALAILAYVAGHAAFLPAATLLILGSSSQLMLNPSLFMMDQAFECFGLLAFGLVVYDLRVRTPASAALVGIGAVTLTLVKPAGSVFMAPLYGLVALVFLFRERRWSWIVPHAIAGLALLLIALSPYGAAVRSHYQLASADYWWREYAFSEVFTWILMVLPLWLIGLAALSLVRYRTVGLPRGLVAAAVLSVTSWLAFNMLLMHTFDPRLMAAAGPIAMTASTIVISRRRALAIATSLVGAALFGISLGSVSGRFASPAALNYAHIVPYAQAPVAEVGLLPLMQRLVAEIDRAEPGEDAVRLMALVNDDFVDNAGLPLALRRVSRQGTGRIRFEQIHWGSDPTALDAMLEVRWFLTKAKRSATALSGDVWTVLEASKALITDPSSPMKDHFEPRFSQTIQQPDLVDEVTLWRLTRRPTALVYLSALRWLESRFRETPGYPKLLQKTQMLAAALNRLPQEETGDVQFHLDHVAPTAKGVQLDGWAFVNGGGLPTGSIFLVLREAWGRREVFTMPPIPRPDVSAHFQRHDLDGAGFSVFLPATTVSAGIYQVGVYVAGSDLAALRFTPHAVEIN